MVSATLINRDDLATIQQIGDVWSRHLALRCTITRSSSEDADPASESADVTISPHPRLATLQYPSLQNVADQWNEEYYSSSDPAHHIWTAFYHMVEERDENHIFGPHYEDSTTVLDKCKAMVHQFNSGNPVHIYLSGLYIADELGCDGPPKTALGEALNLIGRLSYRNLDPVPSAGPSAENTTEGASPHKRHVRVYDTNVTIDTNFLTRYALVYVDFGETNAESDVDGEQSQKAAELLVKASIDDVGCDPKGQAHRSTADSVADCKNAFSFSYTPSQLAKLASTQAQKAGVRYYAKMSGAVMKHAAERTKALVRDIAIEPMNTIRWVADFVGDQQAVLMAAVESDGGMQARIGDVSYSMFSVAQDQRDSLSLAATAADLRDVARLGWESNAMISGPSGQGTRLIVPAEQRDGLVAVREADGELVNDHIPDQAKIR